MPRGLLLPLMLALFVSVASMGFGAAFEELELPPEGSHGGQMLLGAFVAVGVPTGDLIDEENAFLDNTTYTFSNETTKAVEVSHLSFGMGLSFEYMPIDYLGLRARLRRTIIVQRSNFGEDYKNWKGNLYSDYAFYGGISVHATTRKMWDITFTPMIGYAVYQYTATPVAHQIVPGYSGSNRRNGSGISYGAELNCTMYFSGGLYISFGFEWLRNPVEISEPYDLQNPQNSRKYLDGKTGGTIDSYCFILSAGYAFSN